MTRIYWQKPGKEPETVKKTVSATDPESGVFQNGKQKSVCLRSAEYCDEEKNCLSVAFHGGIFPDSFFCHVKKPPKSIIGFRRLLYYKKWKRFSFPVSYFS